MNLCTTRLPIYFLFNFYLSKLWAGRMTMSSNNRQITKGFTKKMRLNDLNLDRIRTTQPQ